MDVLGAVLKGLPNTLPIEGKFANFSILMEGCIGSTAEKPVDRLAEGESSVTFL